MANNSLQISFKMDSYLLCSELLLNDVKCPQYLSLKSTQPCNIFVVIELQLSGLDAENCECYDVMHTVALTLQSKTYF